MSVSIRVAGASALLVLAVGCSAVEPSSRPTPEPAGRAAGQVAPATGGAAVPDCFAGTSAVVSRVSESGQPHVISLGSGDRGVVFAPISWEDACQWAAQAIRLADAGYRVSSVNWVGGRSQTIAAATADLRAAGAERVVVVGACMGATVALADAAGLSPRPDGIAAISPVASLGGVDVDPGLRDYQGPVLLMGTADDPLSDQAELDLIADLHPGGEQVEVYSGEAHGADIFAGEHEADAVRALDAFLRRAMG